MRILVSAASDSDGANLTDRSKAWTELMRQGLERRKGVLLHPTYRQLYVRGFDREAILSSIGNETAFLGDLIHRQEALHERMATEMLELLAPGGAAAAGAG